MVRVGITDQLVDLMIEQVKTVLCVSYNEPNMTTKIFYYHSEVIFLYI